MSQGGYLDDLPHHNSSALLASLQERAAARAQPTSSRSKHGRSSRRDRDLSDIDDSEYSGQRDDETESEDSWNTEDEEAEEARLAQEEWDEGIKQLQTAVQVMLLPFVGKWLGRKWSYWGELIAELRLRFGRFER